MTRVGLEDRDSTRGSSNGEFCSKEREREIEIVFSIDGLEGMITGIVRESKSTFVFLSLISFR